MSVTWVLGLLATLPSPCSAQSVVFGFLDDGSQQAQDTQAGITSAFTEINTARQGLCGTTTVTLFSGGSGDLLTRGNALASSGSSFVGFLGAVGSSAVSVAASLSQTYNLSNIAAVSGSNAIQGNRFLSLGLLSTISLSLPFQGRTYTQPLSIFPHRGASISISFPQHYDCGPAAGLAGRRSGGYGAVPASQPRPGAALPGLRRRRGGQREPLCSGPSLRADRACPAG